jgi:hypothetical protein
MISCLAMLGLVPSVGLAQEWNWIKNGDFTSTAGWLGSFTTEPGRNGAPAAYLENKQPGWNSAEQQVALPQPPPPAVEISGWMKCDGVVQGMKDWEMCRITVVFFDAKGTQVGGWPADIARENGTKEWANYSNQYSVPSGAATAKVSVVLDNCSGKGWFSGLKMSVYDFDLKPMGVGSPATHPDRKPPTDYRTENWLLDPGFETPGSNDWLMGHISSEGRQSMHSLAVENAVPSWNLPSQDVSFQGKNPTAIVYGGWVKTEAVTQGTQVWETARLGVDFRDANNKQVGGWQDTACKVTGTTDWTYYEKKYDVPPGSASVHVDAGLGNCVGKAWFDDLSLALLDKDGKKIPVERKTQQATDTSDWYAYQPPPAASDAPLDLSFLNDAPAGTHGFVTNLGGHFTFADGTRVRFWGTDGVGPNLFIGHDEADQVAARMRKLGINLVRLHFLDNQWGELSLFDPKADNTQTFFPDTLDKLDYLIAALKKNGIYVYPDWSVGRKFRAGDKVPGSNELEEGAKTVIHFSRRVIELNKKYAQMLLTHVNPYTGLALKDDPVYVGNEIVNESSIFCGFGEQKFPQPFWDELQRMYQAWGGHGAITHFKFDFDTQKLLATQNPENEAESLRFLLQEIVKTNREMKNFLAPLSLHALLTGSNMGLPVLGNIYSDSVMDFMDSHAYWDHPQYWNITGGWANVEHAPMNNNSQLMNPFQGSLLFGLAQDPVEGKPFLCTEWNDCFPNEYRLEGPVLMAAYGSLQDWDGLLQFCYGPSLIGKDRMSNFDINGRPDNEPLYIAGALLFREGLLKPSQVHVVEPLTDAQVLAPGMRSDWLFDHPWLPYVAKVEKRFTGAKSEPPASLADIRKYFDEGGKEIDSSTGEETLYYGKGILKIDSPQAQGLVGALSSGNVNQVWGTSGMWIHAGERNPWTAILAISLDHRPLGQSRKIMVFAVARAENSGQVYNATRTALKDAGHPPVLMQGVEGEISIVVDKKADFQVLPLDSSGKAGEPIGTTFEKGGLKFKLSPRYHTSYYLLQADVRNN